jgi:hypothetical protein
MVDIQAKQLLVQCRYEPAMNDVLRDLMGRHSSMGRGLTRAQADEFEKVDLVFIPQDRHRSIQDVWANVWNFLQRNPSFMSSTIDGVMHKFVMGAEIMEASPKSSQTMCSPQEVKGEPLIFSDLP